VSNSLLSGIKFAVIPAWGYPRTPWQGEESAMQYPSLKMLLSHPDEEKENASLVRTLRETPL
jgi:hypothetical protein